MRVKIAFIEMLNKLFNNINYNLLFLNELHERDIVNCKCLFDIYIHLKFCSFAIELILSYKVNIDQ